MDLFDTGLCALLLLDGDGTVLRQGRGWGEVLGWRDDLVGKRVLDLCVPEHVPRFERALRNVNGGAPSAVVQARFPRNGTELRLACRLEPLAGGIGLVAEDMGERRALMQRASTLQSLVDYATDAWMVHDLDGIVRDANPRAWEQLGYTREELLGMRVADFETTIRPGRMDGVWNRLELGRAMTVEGCQRRKDGSTLPVEVSLRLFETEDDEVLMLAVARDITDRKRQEEELRRLNEHLEDEVAARTREVAATLAERQAMLDQLTDGLVALDARGEVRLRNPAFLDLIGDDTFPADLSALAAEAGAAAEPRRVELPLSGGRIGLAVASPLHDGGAVVLLRDVTLEHEIDRMKTDFIATVSHELRTPLTSVLGFAKLTRNKLEEAVFPHVPDDDRRARRTVERVRANMDIILSEGERLTTLINDVLDISKMESGRVDWTMREVDPAQLVARAAEATSSLFDGNPVQLSTEVASDLPQVTGDLDRLLQVLINLVSNAHKFTTSGRVTLGARPVEGGVELFVSDTGSGIDPSLHQAIFEKFKQLGDTLTDKPRGTGLGLPICQQIARAHGSEIRVRSAAGEGSTFSFALPRTDGASPAEPLDHLLDRIARTRPPRETSGRDILVVDDDPSLRELLDQQLTDRGYEVRLAANGYEAIAAVREKRPDLVILDVMMPELSGFDVAALLRNDPATESIPILILSIVRDDQRGLRLGIDRYLTKPASEEDLVGSVQELLREVSSPRRVLLVDERRATGSDIERLLAAKGFQVVGTCTGPECLPQAREHRPDLIIVDAVVDGHEELVRTIRFERDLEHVLVVQLMEPSGE